MARSQVYSHDDEDQDMGGQGSQAQGAPIVRTLADFGLRKSTREYQQLVTAFSLPPITLTLLNIAELERLCGNSTGNRAQPGLELLLQAALEALAAHRPLVVTSG